MTYFWLPHTRRLSMCVLAWACLGSAAVHAEKADRSKPMTVEADQPGSVDLQRQLVIFNDNVVISQGTMQLRAERVELRETSLVSGGNRKFKIQHRGTPAMPVDEHCIIQRRDGFFDIVERMRAVDTSGVEPLYTPLSAFQTVRLRLRDDVVTESDQRQANQASAPAVEDGLFLVPKVIE